MRVFVCVCVCAVQDCVCMCMHWRVCECVRACVLVFVTVFHLCVSPCVCMRLCVCVHDGSVPLMSKFFSRTISNVSAGNTEIQMYEAIAPHCILCGAHLSSRADIHLDTEQFSNYCATHLARTHIYTHVVEQSGNLSKHKHNCMQCEEGSEQKE